MKIVVIGRTHRIRTETVESLRQRGHQAVLPLQQSRFDRPGAAPRDPGHAGRPLRDLLESTAALLGGLWRNQIRPFGRRARATAHREEGVR